MPAVATILPDPSNGHVIDASTAVRRGALRCLEVPGGRWLWSACAQGLGPLLPAGDRCYWQRGVVSGGSSRRQCRLSAQSAAVVEVGVAPRLLAVLGQRDGCRQAAPVRPRPVRGGWFRVAR